ncbi:LMBR1-like membrane protein-domain-containing protein [Linnemannia elongata]|nr:LMBR1-like membrane protein-domain-containing protein [Linnemannia elongata]
MAILALVAGALAVVTLVAGLLNYFGNRVEHAWYVSLIAYVSWFFPFSIVVLVPLDLASTLFRGCKVEEECNEPLMYVSSEFLIGAWRTIYWCSFALTWVLIPLLQSYTQSGDFTVMKRFRSAVRYNIIYQLIVGSIALLGLVFLFYAKGPSNLRAYIMALSNSWGLVLVVIFMGYGMVDVPRRLWHKGDNARELRRISFKASVVKDKRQDTEDEVHNVAKELSVVCHKVQHSDPLRPYVDKMVEGFPAVRGVQFESNRTSSPIPPSQSQRSELHGMNASLPLGSSRTGTGTTLGGRKHSMDGLVPNVITEKYLADLHARIKRALRMSDRWNAIWRDLQKAGFLAQDIQENMDNPEKKFRSTLRPLTSKPKNWQLSLEWVWHLKLRPILLRSLAAVCAALSLLIVWSEMTYQNVNPVLSVIGLLVQVARDRMSYGAIEAVSFFTMLYMCTCAYTTLMKMKLLNNYVLVPNHHTDEPTLLFIGSYLCRLTFPLVYNYLTISAAGKEDSTVFAGYMGKIDMVPLLGDFNYYMPYVILVPTLITLFNVFAKMFAICSISDNFFDNDDDEGGIGGDLEEGVQVLKDARRDEERRLLPERTGLNRDFTARRGAAFETYNNNKNKQNRRRGDAPPTHSMLGEGSSANAWRDVRPSPSGNSQRPFHEPYFDDSTDDDDSGSVFTGFGRRESADHMGSSAPGAGAGTHPGGRGRSSIDSPSRGNLHRHTTKLDTPPTPGPFKSLWQKMVGPKQAIALDGTNTFSDPTDSDGARSSIESTGHEGGHVPSSYTGRNTFRPDRNSSSAAGRTGPALMFASVQQQPSSYSRSSLQEDENRDRDRLLSVHDARTRHGGSSGSSSRAHSPQGRVIGHGGQGGQGGQGGTNSGRNSRPNSRIFGASSPQNGNSTNRQPSPLINIFDDDD